MRYYKWTANKKPVYGNGDYVLTGEPQPRIEGDLTMCERGYHVCTTDQVAQWCGTELWEVEPIEIVERGSDKTLCRSWRVVKQIAWTIKDAVAYARACADRAQEHAACTTSYATITAAASVDDYAARADADAAHAAVNIYTADADAADAAASAAACVVATAAAAAARNTVIIAAASDTEREWQRKWIENRIGETLD